MDVKEFEERMYKLLPQISSKAMENFQNYATELGRDDVIPASEFFMETYVELDLVKKHYGEEIAQKLFDLGESFTLNPFEIRGAANHLQNGTEVEKIKELALDGDCDYTEQERKESEKAKTEFKRNNPHPNKKLSVDEQLKATKKKADEINKINAQKKGNKSSKDKTDTVLE